MARPAHRDLLLSRDTTHDPIKVMLQARRNFDSLPKTNATFRRTELIDDEDIGAAALTEEMLNILGSWKMPPWFPGNSNRRSKYINPKNPFAWRYSDVFPKCECGARITHIDNTYTPIEDSDIREDHSEDCPRIWKWRTRLKLAEKRQDSMKQWFRYGHYTSEIGHRIGYTKLEVTDAHTDHNVDVNKQREYFRKAVANVAIDAIERHPPKAIAECYGVTNTCVTDWIHKYGWIDVDLKEKHKIRNSY